MRLTSYPVILSMKKNDSSTTDLEMTKYETFEVSKKPRWFKRYFPYFTLILICIGCFAQNFCYENPAPFQNQLQEYMGLTATKYNMYFSFYFFPNMITPLLTGYFADVCGRRLGLLATSSMILIGQFFFAFGIFTKSFFVSVLGRMIFGMGSESYAAVALECLSFWNYEFLCFSLAIQSAALGAGSGLNDFLLPHIYSATNNLLLGFYIGVGIALVCVIASIIFAIMEICATKDRVEVNSEESIKLSGILKFPLVFWLLTLHVSFFDTNTSSFSAIAAGMAQTRFGFDVKESGVLLCVPMITIIIGSLVCGIIIDRIKRYSTFSIIASVLQLAGFVILTFVSDDVPKLVIFICFGLYGLSSAIFLTSYWPCIKFVVQSGLTTTAYGLNLCLQDIFMFMAPIFIGMVIDKTVEYSGGYKFAVVIFSLIALSSTITSIAVYYVDYKHKRVLHDKTPTYSEIKS